MSVVDLPESYKDALADATGTFRASFQPFHCAWKLSGRFSNQQHLTGTLPNEGFAKYYAVVFETSISEQGSPGGWMVWAMYLSMGTRHDYRDALKGVAAPVLVVHGADDLQPEEASRIYVDAFPKARFHAIEGATHFPFYEQPEEFAAVVGEFLSELE